MSQETNLRNLHHLNDYLNHFTNMADFFNNFTHFHFLRGTSFLKRVRYRTNYTFTYFYEPYNSLERVYSVLNSHRAVS